MEVGDNMNKFDVKKEYPELYHATSKKISHVKVPKLKYIAIDGIGNPTVPEFKEKSKLMFLVNKTLRKYYQNEEIAFSGAKLEGIWDTYDNSHFDVTRKQMIKYTLMMLQPPILTHKMLEDVKASLFAKTSDGYVLDVYLKEFEEGECIQMLHIGPYNTEINSTKEIMEYITVANLKLCGLHHEIYLNKPERVAAENLKTIVRYPVEEDLR